MLCQGADDRRTTPARSNRLPQGLWLCQRFRDATGPRGQTLGQTALLLPLQHFDFPGRLLAVIWNAFRCGE